MVTTIIVEILYGDQASVSRVAELGEEIGRALTAIPDARSIIATAPNEMPDNHVRVKLVGDPEVWMRARDMLSRVINRETPLECTLMAYPADNIFTTGMPET